MVSFELSAKFSRRMGRPPWTIFGRLDRPVNALQRCRRQYSHKETLKQTFFKQLKVHFFDEERPFCVFETPLDSLGNVRCSSYARSLESAYSGFSDYWTFFAMCYGWGATGEWRLKIGVFEGTAGPGWPKMSGTKGINHTSFWKTGMILFHGIKMCA